MQFRFIKSAVYSKDYPDGQVPEIAMIGRSNAGKSSFINALAGSAKMAKVSSTPGKTRLINFFDCNGVYRWVDLPGYGFAARGGDEIRDWQKMIETYLLEREQLVGLCLIMDIRRDWTEDEQVLKNLAESRGLSIALILNKIDKEKKNTVRSKLMKVRKQHNDIPVFAVSSAKGLGVVEAEEYIFDHWIQSEESQES